MAKKTKRMRNPPETVEARQIKKAVVEQLNSAMEADGVSQSELARRMVTSRAVVHRLLKADDISVTLATLANAFAALKRTVSLKSLKTATA